MKDICTTFAIIILNVYTFLNVYTMDIRVVTSDAMVACVTQSDDEALEYILYYIY